MSTRFDASLGTRVTDAAANPIDAQRRPPFPKQDREPDSAEPVRARALVPWVMCASAATGALVGAVSLTVQMLRFPGGGPAAGAMTLETNAALALALAGLSLLLLHGGGKRASLRRATGAALAVVVLLIGALTLGQHLFGLDFGIDQLLMTEPAGRPGVLSPNRMGPPAALSFTLLGAGLLYLAWGWSAATWLGTATCALMLVPAVGLLYGVRPLHSNPYLTSIAGTTLAGLLALGLALSLAEPRRGAVPLLWRDDPGGALLRRLLGPAVGLPILLGYLRLLGERRGLYDLPVGTGLFAITLSVIFGSLLWQCARRLSTVGAERVRAESESTWRAGLLDLAQDAIFVWSPERGIESWNRGAVELYGFDAREVMGRRAHDLLQAGFPGPKQELPEALFRNGRWEGELRHRTKAGSWVTVSSRMQVVSAPDGRVRVLESNRDVTAARRSEDALRTSERQYRALAENSPEVIARFDRALRHTYVNEFGAKVYGVPVSEVLGKTNAELGMPPDKVAFWKERFEQVFATGRQQTVEFEFESPNLGHQHLSSIFVPETGEGGDVASILAITRDITPKKLAEEELRASEARLQKAVSAPTVGVLFFNLDGTVHGANPAFERMSGYSSEGLRRLEHWKKMTAPEFWECTARTAEGLATRGEAEPYEKEMIRADGSRWWGLFAPTVLSGSGHSSECVEFIIDITQRKRVEEALRASEERFRSILANMSEGVMLFDAGGNLIYQNRASLRIHGFDPDAEGRIGHEALPTTWKAWDENGRAITFDEWPVSRVFRNERFENQLLRVERVETGRVFHGSYNGSPILDGRGERVLGFITIRDITEETRAAAALKESEVRSRDLADTIRVANERLLEADRRKNEFLAMLSHELRNPLAPIKNSLYILGKAPPGGPQAKRAHEVIGRQVMHMTRLIDDLLDVTRISRGKVRLQRERVELCDLLHRTAEDHRALFEARDIQLEMRTCESPLYTQGDHTRLAQVIGNLLSNAVKFTPSGGRVQLSLAREGATAAFHVRDNGAGIVPDLLNKLFEPFVQADATLDRSKGGLGLGLALVKGLVELHGGSVEARSAGPGKGAEFVVRLPVERAQSDWPSVGVARPRVGRRRPLRVLLIEDNVDAAESLKEALEMNGHGVELAATGFEGIEKAREFRPDVVLCDIGLPGIDGFEVARRMRADPDLSVAPLVALSGYAAPEDLEKSKEAGFVQHLAKPPDLGALEAALCEAGARGR